MIIQHLNSETVGLKIGTTMVTLSHDGKISVGDKSIEGPGEYDINGVGIHAYSTHALLFSEGIRTAVVWGGDGHSTENEEVESSVYIVLINDDKVVNTIIKEQDPRMIVIHDADLADELAKEDGVAIVQETSYKITSQSLPTENRVFVLLA